MPSPSDPTLEQVQKSEKISFSTLGVCLIFHDRPRKSIATVSAVREKNINKKRQEEEERIA